MRIGLVGCGKAKRGERSAARDLYAGDLFRAARDYCERHYDWWFVLSARHGLVEPSRVLDPYDETLAGKPAGDRAAWGERVASQIDALGFRGATFGLHAGSDYASPLESRIKCRRPLAGLGIGEQLAWYKARRKQDPRFYCVATNRDVLNVRSGSTVERKPLWDFVSSEQRDWLTSLVYLQRMAPPPGRRFLDCGAWSYKDKESPKWPPAECVERYVTVASPGDIVAAPDHMILRDHDEAEQERRRAITIANAREFVGRCPDHLSPIAVIHGRDVPARLGMAEAMLDFGYTHLAVGSVAGERRRPFVVEVLEGLAELRSRRPFYLHVLGLSALSWYPTYRRLGVDSFDGSAMFFAAFTGATYYALRDDGTIAKHVVKGVDPESIPACDCPACVAMRTQGDDTRTMGNNERNMGRAIHNINVYLAALERLRSAPSLTEPQGRLFA